MRETFEVDPALVRVAVERLARADRLVVDDALRAEAGFVTWRAELMEVLGRLATVDVVPVDASAAVARRHLDAVDRAWNLVVASRPHVLAWPAWFEQLTETTSWARALAERGQDGDVVDRADRVGARVADGLSTARRAREAATLDDILDAHEAEVARLEREFGMRDAVGGGTLAGRRHLWRLADRLVDLEGQLAELHDPFPGPDIGHRRRRVLDLLNRVESERQVRVRAAADEPAAGVAAAGGDDRIDAGEDPPAQ